MAGWGTTPADGNNIPMGSVGVPGDSTPRVLQGGAEYTDSNGNVTSPAVMSLVDGWKATYSFAKVGLAPAASATDIFTITGSASKTVRITRIEISGTCTVATGSALDVLLVKRSTADTAGTSTGSPTAVPHDSNNAAATATVLAYTANPTVGSIVGTAIRNMKLALPINAATATDFPDEALIIWEFGNRPGTQALVLRGIAQVVAINLNGVSAPTGTSLNIAVELTEE